MGRTEMKRTVRAGASKLTLLVRRWLGIDAISGTPCEWCSSKIERNPWHAPIPLCVACFKEAYKNCTQDSPYGNLWGRMSDDYRNEAFAWAARLQGREGGDVTEQLETLVAEQSAEVLSLQAQVGAAMLRKDDAERERLWAQVVEKLMSGSEITGPLKELKAANAENLGKYAKREDPKEAGRRAMEIFARTAK